MSKKIVLYTGNDEILITLKKNENKMLEDYGDRDFENDYYREETDDNSFVIRISTSLDTSVE